MTPPIRLLPFAGQSEAASRPNLFRPLDIAKGGMSVQRARIETAVTNIANAETTRTAAGGPYQRRVVRIEEVPRDQPGLAPLPFGPEGPTNAQSPTDALAGVEVVAIEEDATPGPLVYNPGHPDADASGYVRMPNVRVTDELVELQEAKRLYEANATVFQAARQMLRRALEL